MGTETAPQRHKSRRQQWRERPDEPEEPPRRSWRDVRKAGVVFGLAAASLPPIAPFLTLVAISGAQELALSELIVSCLFLIAVAGAWFVAAGMFFLIWHGKRHEIVERFDCLTLCSTLTFFLPTIISLGSLFFTDELDLANPGTILVLALVGLCLMPLGTLGGWMLWRVGIHPAARPLREIAEVF